MTRYAYVVTGHVEYENTEVLRVYRDGRAPGWFVKRALKEQKESGRHVYDRWTVTAYDLFNPEAEPRVLAEVTWEDTIL